jgi:D-alanyl-D-alanine carboxypeptidase/D-alanyl-D-alanine-endopeptidase (penicillin-binding protein 4)
MQSIPSALRLLAAALLLSGCAALRPTELPPTVQQALDQAGLPASGLAYVAIPLHQRERTIRLRDQQPMQPASTMKLVTTIVALDRLGLDARGRTELLAADPVQGDVLSGPLYLRGGADTDLDWGALHTLLRQLREQGVREIRGGLVVDRTLFKPARADLGVPPFDEQPEFQYNQIPDALQLNVNLLDVQLQSDATSVQARLFPAWPGLSIDASGLTVAEGRCADWEDGWKIPQVDQGRIQLQGVFPARCSQRPELNLIDRQLLTAAAVRQLWRELGGVMAGNAQGDVEAATPATARVLARHDGRPLAEVAREMLKASDNPLTRLTYLRLGAASPKAADHPRTVDAAEAEVRSWLAAHDIADQGLVLDNGSGLSRSERITPAQLAAMIVAALDGPRAPELLTALPVAGVDGTLRNRLKTPLTRDRARLKTGTLNNVVALAGVVPDRQNRPWVVAVMLNAPQAGAKGRAVLDAWIEWVAAQ